MSHFVPDLGLRRNGNRKVGMPYDRNRRTVCTGVAVCAYDKKFSTRTLHSIQKFLQKAFSIETRKLFTRRWYRQRLTKTFLARYADSRVGVK